MSVNQNNLDSWRFSIAPMLDWTDRHCRFLLRLIFPHARLYTEMVTSGALIHGDAQRFLAYDVSEHPLALQLGGSDPADMSVCAQMAESAGFDEVNINVGCPSDRVQSGAFGACLMSQPQQVADCVAQMRSAVTIPITVKSRIGIDDQNEHQVLPEFIRLIAEAGCETFIIHARKAWLKGLSPKENRDIPPLNYDLVYQMKREFPSLRIIVNGGIKTSDQIMTHMDFVDGVMIGRQAYQNPTALLDAYRLLFPKDALLNFHEVVYAYLPYLREQIEQGVPLRHMTRHMLGLFHGTPGAKQWRRLLSEFHDVGNDTDFILSALADVSTQTNWKENE